MTELHTNVHKTNTVLAQCRRVDLHVAANNAYELLDSGNHLKLERYGTYVVERPEPMALWKPRLNPEEWRQADLIYRGKAGKGMWESHSEVPEKWTVDFDGVVMEVRPWSFKHTGIFPEHQPHWVWMQKEKKEASAHHTMLNLFGYTGGASIAGAKAGFTVTHVDASKPSVAAAGDNARATFGGENPIRLIVDDAAAFVKRELRRGTTYDAIVLDPPSFGRGSQGQVWKIEEQLPEFLESIVRLLSQKPSFILLNGYASGYSADTYMQVLIDTINRVRPDLARGIEAQYGDMSIIESAKDDSLSRVLSTGIYARAAFSDA